MSEDISKLMLVNYQYPSQDDEDFQEKIYSKRDFHVNKIIPRAEGNRLEQFRSICTATSTFKPTPTQIFISKFINPKTPYPGLLVIHGTGVGKSAAAVLPAENFKPYVEKYGVKIHVLVPGALNKEGFINEILKVTGETYTKDFVSQTDVIGPEERERKRREAVALISQYYRIMTHASFTKKVVGEKIKAKTVKDGKLKKVYQTDDSGEIERIYPVDRIFSLDNTLLIVDEAHGVTGNDTGEALRKIVDASHNLKLLLLTATPMKDSADSIVELLNYLRPKDQPIERDKVFTSQKGHSIQFKPNGENYLRKMSRGYVSYVRGQDPLTFAEREDIGVIPPGLLFTKVIRCEMGPFQLAAYRKVIDSGEDSFDRVSGAVSNFVWPGVSKDVNSKLMGYYGIKGMTDIKNQLQINADKLTTKVCSELLDCDHPEAQSLMYLINNNRTISGDIYTERYLKTFSTKFYRALKNINDNVAGKKGSGPIFVFSNLRQVGVELFQEVLKMNGYLEFQENPKNYVLLNNTKCYFCGETYGKHVYSKKVPEHTFSPATFIMITGKADDSIDQVPEEKFRILKNHFNVADNFDGKNIKLILGSKVMNEGITLRNIKEIHILDVHFNLGRVDQVIGRGIRFCTHFDTMNEDNLWPKVKIYKYVVSLKTGELSTEEEMYRKAELKYVMVKKVERILAEEAVDCPLNLGGNIFPEELVKYGDCKGTDCPAVCGYMPCTYKCAGKRLNAKYYDASRNIYRSIAKDKLDYTTYDISMATEEINEAKDIIKTMYKAAHVFDRKQILKRVKQSYPREKRELFDELYVDQALAQLLPVSENDFNNFQDTITDKFNRPGYLIYRGGYYIFQPFDENENLPMFYRQHYQPKINHKLDIKDFMKHSTAYVEYSKQQETKPSFVSEGYTFDESYYENRNDNDVVGIIEKESAKKRARNPGLENDEFKIRGPMPKVIEKKRQTGLPSFLGSVCAVSKDRDHLATLAKSLNIDIGTTEIRQTICDMIKDKLFDLEKYSDNNVTYMIVPTNHPKIPFPLNLKDRVEWLVKTIEEITRTKPKITKHKTKGIYPDINYHFYTLAYESNPKHNETYIKYGAEKIKTEYVIKIE